MVEMNVIFNTLRVLYVRYRGTMCIQASSRFFVHNLQPNEGVN